MWVNQIRENGLGFYYFYLWCNTVCMFLQGWAEVILHLGQTWVPEYLFSFSTLSFGPVLLTCVTPQSQAPPGVNCSSPIDSRSPLGVGAVSWAKEVFYLSPGAKHFCIYSFPRCSGSVPGPWRQEVMLSPAVVNVFYSYKRKSEEVVNVSSPENIRSTTTCTPVSLRDIFSPGSCPKSSHSTQQKLVERSSRRMWTTVRSKLPLQFSSVQFSRSVISDSSWPHGPQHARPPCTTSTPRVYSNSSPLSQWCHSNISSVAPFCVQSSPASGSFQMSQLFTSGGQSIGVWASVSVLPMNTQDWSPLGWTGWISLQSKGLSRVFSNTISVFTSL